MSVYPNLQQHEEHHGGRHGTSRAFHEVDADGDGGVELHELRKVLPDSIPDSQVIREFEKFDTNGDGRLDREEYRNMVRRRAFHFANLIVLPKNQRLDETDGPYTEEYSCMPPPVFMFAISLIEIGIFAYHTHRTIGERGWVGINGPAPVDSVLIYSPYRRCEAWRYLTYMFVHSGWVHICNNVIMQLFLGVLLEMVHKWWRVLIVYFAGVIAGSLATSVTDPDYYLAGASGGVYALITAHIATVILNWGEMELPWVRVLLFSAFCVLDVGIAIYYRYFGDIPSKVGYAAHFGGALAGLLLGIHVLRNLRPQKWETFVWRVSICIWVVLAGVTIAWNAFYTSYYPEQEVCRISTQ